jgi:predicted nucleotidyltransferase
MESSMERAQMLLERLRLWASQKDDVRALLLVGSFARGEARPESDVDIVLLTNKRSPAGRAAPGQSVPGAAPARG